ncbi:hypothetical protein [Azospirillum thiophilum]|nr:hypothetical protein [Azospirillum thiophilum]
MMLGLLVVGIAPALAQPVPWMIGNAKGWFTATKTDDKGNKLAIVCDAATQEQAAIMYMPRIPVRGIGQIKVSLGLDGTVVPAGSWQIIQGGVAIKDYATVVDLAEKMSEALMIDIFPGDQPGASFDSFGFEEVSKGLAQACGR